jgi:ankyrin repeat protein
MSINIYIKNNDIYELTALAQTKDLTTLIKPTHLFTVCKYGFYNIAKLICKLNVMLSPKHKTTQKTPLMYAIEKKHNIVAKLFIDKGADLTAVDNSGYSALSWAVMSNNIEMVQYLIDKGADINIVNSDGIGLTTLCGASGVDGYPDILLLLLNNQVVFNNSDIDYFRTILHHSHPTLKLIRQFNNLF